MLAPLPSQWHLTANTDRRTAELLGGRGRAHAHNTALSSSFSSCNVMYLQMGLGIAGMLSWRQLNEADLPSCLVHFLKSHVW